MEGVGEETDDGEYGGGDLRIFGGLGNFTVRKRNSTTKGKASLS